MLPFQYLLFPQVQMKWRVSHRWCERSHYQRFHDCPKLYTGWRRLQGFTTILQRSNDQLFGHRLFSQSKLLGAQLWSRSQVGSNLSLQFLPATRLLFSILPLSKYVFHFDILLPLSSRNFWIIHRLSFLCKMLHRKGKKPQRDTCLALNWDTWLFSPSTLSSEE